MQEREAMRHPAELYRRIGEAFARRKRMVLATVLSRSGSGPREPGAAMAVMENGDTLGTVGGGPLEAETLVLAQTVLTDRRPACRTFFLTDRQAATHGMICGGRMEVLVDYLDGSDCLCRALLDKVIQALDAGQGSWLVRSIGPPGDDGTVETGLAVIDRDGFHAGSLDLSGFDGETFAGILPDRLPLLIGNGPVRYFVEPVTCPETVFIFGAGHVGRELAALSTLVGFRTVVLDDRREFASRERFPVAERIVIEAYPNCCDGLEVGPSAYIVIATRGHAFDRDVLASALKTSARYIGMIASRRKREVIYQALREAGVSAEALAAVHCPVGLAIGARTPVEIAVSIVAELIAVRETERARLPVSGYSVSH